MVAVEFNSLFFNLVVLLSAMVPGIAIGWPLLHRAKPEGAHESEGLSVLEKLAICFFIGLVSAPALLLLESFAGIGFSLQLALADILILTAAGIFLGVKNSAFSLSMPAMPKVEVDSILTAAFAKKHAATVLLLLALLLSFWARMAPLSPIYSELDPYWYVYGSGQIIREGAVPLYDDTAWFPEIQSTHRSVPLKAYTDALWYALYTGGAEYNNYILFMAASWLPPVASALVAFGAYLLFSAMYGKRYGIFAAFLMAFLPITIFKMSAGVNEATPYGLVGLLLMLAFYALALRKKDMTYGYLAGAAAAVCTLGSNYEAVMTLAFSAFVVLQSIDYYLRGTKNEHFWKLNIILAAAIVASNVIDIQYNTGSIESVLMNLLTGRPIMAIGAVALCFAAEKAVEAGWSQKKRQNYLAIAAVAAVLLLIATPLGAAASERIFSFVGYASFNQPLDRTIAEQNKAGASFEGEAGFIALIPANHEIAAPKDAVETAVSLAYGALGLATLPFTALGNGALSLADAAFNLLLGGNGLATGEKSNSLLMFFLVTASIGLAWRHFSRKGDERNVPSVMLLMLLFILPVAYVGLNKIKFVLFVGLAAVIAAVASIAEIERLALWLAGRAKAHDLAPKIGVAFLVLMALIAYVQAAGPMPYAKLFLLKAFEPRYQDNPQAAMPKMASICKELQAKGYNEASICAAGSDMHFADTINGQFDSNICVISQLSMQELLPGSSASEQAAASEARTAAQFRCSRLNVYWIDSMEWIRNSLGPSDRVTSWWDYGHWINFFGDRNAVLRNEHRSKGMIGRVAHDYLDGTPEDLATTMNYYDSQYVLFDYELTGGLGGAFGGKYGALNYLSCAHDNETSTAVSPGGSDCEFDHMPERLLVPKYQVAGTTCTISESQQTTGVVAFRITNSGIDSAKPDYCIGEATLADGQKISGTYYMDRRDANGDLVLSKGFLRQIDEQADASIVEVVYNSQKVWPANGTAVDGMEDAKGKFYTSNLYRGMFLDDLPGFDLVYTSKNAEVKIYRLRNFVGNKEGIIDPVAAARTQ